VKGSRGAFEVALDGEVVYSKLATGRFPDPDEVENALAPKVA
jgi:selT/selW/selH-like putative selenoprotein